MTRSLSNRSRSDLTIDSLTESQIGSVTGSESGLLGSVSSLNDTHDTTNDDTETEQQDEFTPVPGKIVTIANKFFASITRIVSNNEQLFLRRY